MEVSNIVSEQAARALTSRELQGVDPSMVIGMNPVLKKLRARPKRDWSCHQARTFIRSLVAVCARRGGLNMHSY